MKANNVPDNYRTERKDNSLFTIVIQQSLRSLSPSDGQAQPSALSMLQLIGADLVEWLEELAQVLLRNSGSCTSRSFGGRAKKI